MQAFAVGQPLITRQSVNNNNNNNCSNSRSNNNKTTNHCECSTPLGVLKECHLMIYSYNSVARIVIFKLSAYAFN